jgi:uncharacterized protein YaeQ
MTLKSDIHKLTLSITDLGRSYVAEHKLTVARHPSETEQRLMLRLIAFALNASPTLKFVGELCNQDEPELCEPGLDGQYRLWVEFGLADEKRIKRACHRADRVLVCAYGGQDLALWWKQHQGKYTRIGHLQVLAFDNQQLDALLPFVERGMHLAITIDEEGSLLISNGLLDMNLQPKLLKPWGLD